MKKIKEKQSEKTNTILWVVYLNEVGQVLQHTYAYFIEVVEEHIKHR